MVLREAMVDAVYSAAVAADIGYELFCTADSALLQDVPGQGPFLS